MTHRNSGKDLRSGKTRARFDRDGRTMQELTRRRFHRVAGGAGIAGIRRRLPSRLGISERRTPQRPTASERHHIRAARTATPSRHRSRRYPAGCRRRRRKPRSLYWCSSTAREVVAPAFCDEWVQRQTRPGSPCSRRIPATSFWDAIGGRFGADVDFLNRALERVFETVAVEPRTDRGRRIFRWRDIRAVARIDQRRSLQARPRVFSRLRRRRDAARPSAILSNT